MKSKIFVFGILAVLMMVSLVSAAEISWSFNKTQTCDIFNYTGTTCDSFWCTNVLDGNWTSDQICTLNQTIAANQTNESLNVTNQTNMSGDYFNASLYYTKNETYSKNETDNMTGFTQAELENTSLKTQMLTIRNDAYDRNQNLSQRVDTIQLNGTYQKAQSLTPTMIVIIIIAVLGTFIYIATMMMKQKGKTETSRGWQKSFRNEFGQQPVPEYVPRREQRYEPQRYGPRYRPNSLENHISESQKSFDVPDAGAFRGKGKPVIQEPEQPEQQKDTLPDQGTKKAKKSKPEEDL